MERLTTRHEGRPALNQGYEERFTEQSLFFMLINRLASYEDTGLEPEEVAELVSPKTVEIARLLEQMCNEGSAQHMLELFQAEKDGLLEILPPNDPLTLEELREMDGEPVWVNGECEIDLGKNGWAFLVVRKTEALARVWWPGEEYADIPSLGSYGDTWTAYRRKPEGTAKI